MLLAAPTVCRHVLPDALAVAFPRPARLRARPIHPARNETTMNTTFMPVRSLDRVQQRLSDLRSRPERLSALDRLSLRVGLWLLLRSARTRRALTREDYERLVAAQRARDEAERAHARVAFSAWYGR